MLETQVKRETSLAKVRGNPGRLKATEPTARGRAHDTGDATLVPSPSVGQQRRVTQPPSGVSQGNLAPRPTVVRLGGRFSLFLSLFGGPPLLPGPHTMWGGLKAGAPAAEEIGGSSSDCHRGNTRRQSVLSERPRCVPGPAAHRIGRETWPP
jgi:hypothetical protein